MTMLTSLLLIAAVLFETEQGGVSLTLTSETTTIDPAKSVFVRLELKTPQGKTAELPDLRTRVKGFSLVEDFEEEPQTLKDGTKVESANWRLLPEPVADEYGIRPFVVRVNGGRDSFIGGPVKFDPPGPREPATGAMEANPEKDLPPLSWKLVGWIALALAGLAAAFAAVWFGIRYLMRRVKEHRMSPIERAWVELDRLLRKGLPGRGRYKDFYVELTLVVRRYVQRQHGVKAPNLTTEEFFEATRQASTFPKSTLDELIDFLRKADMVKFAGVEATPETADAATASAKTYMAKDDQIMATKKPLHAPEKAK